jgi:hypothetical protein
MDKAEIKRAIAVVFIDPISNMGKKRNFTQTNTHMPML